MAFSQFKKLISDLTGFKNLLDLVEKKSDASINQF